MDVKDNLSDVWGELEDDFTQSTPSRPTKKLELPYLERHQSFSDRFNRAFFNGYSAAAVLAIATLWLNSFHLGKHAQGAHVNLASVVPALLLASITAPLFDGRRKTILLSLLAAPLAAGVYCFLSGFIDAGISAAVSTNELSTFDLGTILQSHVEVFLGVPSVVLAISAVALAQRLSRQHQLQLPWFEVPPASRRKTTAAVGLVALPLLTVLGLQVQGLLLERTPEIQWYRNLSRSYPEVTAPSRNNLPNRSSLWRPIERHWRSNLAFEKPFTDTTKEATPDSLLWEVEERALKLLALPNVVASGLDFEYQSVKRLLLQRQSDLKHPHQTLSALLKADSAAGQRAYDASTVRTISMALREGQFSEPELRDFAEGLTTWYASRQPLIERLDVTVAALSGSTNPYRPLEPRPLTAFGTSVLYSPNQIFVLKRKVPAIRLWLELRDELTGLSPQEITRVLDDVARERQLGRSDLKFVVGGLHDIARGDHLTSLDFGVAQLNCAARLYQTEHGRLPERMGDLAPYLRPEVVTEPFTLQLTQHGLKIEAKGPSGRPLTWVLK